MDRGRRVWHRASGCFRSGQQSARRQGLRSGKMDGVRVRSRHGSASHDFVRYSRHPLLCAKRSALSPPVRMKFFVNWLGEFVDLPEDPEEIADLLTRAGVETKNIETRGAKIDNVIVSQITASSRHPNADRLTVCEVNDGSGTKRQIVCGATNYKVGDKVPLALPGAKLPNGTEIRKSKLRSVEWKHPQINAARSEDRHQEDWRDHQCHTRMSIFLRPQDRQRESRAESAMVARENRERRHSVDQQHRRHLELRDAGARPADA